MIFLLFSIYIPLHFLLTNAGWIRRIDANVLFFSEYSRQKKERKETVRGEDGEEINKKWGKMKEKERKKGKEGEAGRQKGKRKEEKRKGRSKWGKKKAKEKRQRTGF